MAITWLIEWRMRSSWGLSLVRGRLMGSACDNGVVPDAASAGLLELEAVTGTGIRWC